MAQLTGKVAIVTGASSGIGKAIAILFAKEGAKVVVSDINDEAGEKVVQEIKDNGGDAVYVHADTSKEEDNKALADAAVNNYGKLDIAVNNAGVGSEMVKVADIKTEDWLRVIGINLNGVFYGLKYQLPAMQKAGGGSIINMASILGQVGFSGAAAYVSAKHALLGLTQTAAVDYGPEKIRVNAVGPGFIYTGLVNKDTMGEEGIKALEAKHPVGRLGMPEEVAALCLFLAGDTSSFITGSYYPVDGGYLAV